MKQLYKIIGIFRSRKKVPLFVSESIIPRAKLFLSLLPVPSDIEENIINRV